MSSIRQHRPTGNMHQFAHGKRIDAHRKPVTEAEVGDARRSPASDDKLLGGLDQCVGDLPRALGSVAGREYISHAQCDLFNGVLTVGRADAPVDTRGLALLSGVRHGSSLAWVEQPEKPITDAAGWKHRGSVPSGGHGHSRRLSHRLVAPVHTHGFLDLLASSHPAPRPVS